MMKISDILKEKGLFAKDIRMRMASGQIKLNGESVREDVELQFETKQELGEVLFELCQNEKFALQLKVFGLEAIHNGNINIELTMLMRGWNILHYAKHDALVLK